ncbi:MAG: biotin/lipoyl-containing protein [Pyrinomonadaceae bacterium]
MKVVVQIGDEPREVEIARDGSSVSANIDGRLYEIVASEPEPNVFLLKHRGSNFEAAVSPKSSGAAEFVVELKGNQFETTVIDPKRLRGSGSTEGDASGRAEIKTAMPGKVVRILVAEGDSVQKGDGVIVVEAMKMQNEMRSPKDGVVSEIKVSENATVAAGDVLLIID